MKLQNLFKIQAERNKSLDILPNLDEYKLNARKLLALNVRVGALANATKCFKYWEDEEVIHRDNILTRYISTLSCILTVGIDKKYTDIESVETRPNEYCLSDQFLNLYVDINDLLVSSSKDHYITLMEDFLSIGHTIGFSEQEIIDNFNSLY
ncbi:dUTP diphosphatase [Clostridium polynesiense]|uniref:dUTP diphosphatase n=1 Tax=Clostridium polynesiense TaxID=1325933 RepID=UPI00058E7E3A|nr:dUTP diphosphatase [Clostridium polynesiense]